MGRNIGARVRLHDGTEAWLKVGGVYARQNRFFLGEPQAAEITGVPKPAMLANVEWTRGMVTWGARLMTLIDAPVVEFDLWAGNRAAHVSDAWIAALKAALERLAPQPARCATCDPRHVHKILDEHYGVAAPPREAWHLAHSDLHWSNLTAPELAILDWEVWGLAPPGYDIAMLIAYSANDAGLVARLEEAFAETLAKPSVRATRLYVLHLVLEMTENGHLDPDMRDSVAGMLEAVRQGCYAGA